jgi:4-amino-4-deoxy-L-arabinose transferase-like glycosyltransferase
MSSPACRRLAAVAAVVAVLAGPAAWTFATVGKGLDGNNVTAGPASASSGGFGRIGGGGAGQDGVASDAALVRYLEARQGGAKYLAATFGAQSSAGLIIASGRPVMTIGGFTGSDPAPTLARFVRMVKAGEVRYVMLGGGFGGGMRGGPGSGSISSWVQSHGTQVSGTSGLYAVHA